MPMEWANWWWFPGSIARQTRVMVVAENSGTGHGFASSGNDQSVVMFDLKTFKTLGRIPAAEDADAIVLRQRV